MDHRKSKGMKERAHRADEFLKIDENGESGTEPYHMIYTDDQFPRPEDRIVLIIPQGKIFCTMEDPATFRKQTNLPLLRVSRVTYR
jgi:hypothetical protein